MKPMRSWRFLATIPRSTKSSLVDEYVLAHEDGGLSPDSLVQMARRSIELSFLDDERKANMLRDFDFLANSPQARLLDQD